MDWISSILRASPELAMFLAVGIGFWAGKFKIGNFAFGTVTASLLAGLVVGQAHVEINRELRWGLFYLFLFANGYSVGPQFFAALKRDGFKPMVLSLVVFVTGLATALLMARMLKLDPGMSAGLYAGGLTHSAAIGTATDAVMALDLPEAQRKLLASHVAVADALTYVFGAVGVMLFASVWGPKLLRVDLRKEAAILEEQLGMQAQPKGILSGAQKFALRAYRLDTARFAGKTVREFEGTRPDARFFVERIRRGDEISDATPDAVLAIGDVLLLYGRHEALVEIGPQVGEERHDDALSDIPVSMLEVVVTNPKLVGPTLETLTHDAQLDFRSIGVRKLSRGGQAMPIGTRTVLAQGDVMELIGPQRAVDRAAATIGYAMRPSDTTSLTLPCFGIVIGALIGLPYVMAGNIKLTLSVSVGALLAGLFFGWLRSRRPSFGNIPQPALQFMIDFGLASFVAGAGLLAGPEFVRAVSENGIGLLLVGVVVTLVPQACALFVGHYILKMNPLLLLGGIAGAQTFTGAMAAVQEKSGSRVPVLGYTVPYATSNVLLTAGGTLMVGLMSL